jgi:hypothetical protein
VSQIVAGAAIEPHSRTVLPSDNPKAVVLDLVQPLAARGQSIGFDGETRRDETGRQGTRQHEG